MPKTGYPRGKWPRETIEETFWARVRKTDTCWLWEGQIRDDGYGILRGRSVHRFAYQLLRGDIPEGLEIDHICSVRNCVRPDHMQCVDHSTNVQLSHARGKHVSHYDRLGSMHRNKTICKNGHPYDSANTRIDEAGRRRCKICDIEKSRRYMVKTKYDVVRGACGDTTKETHEQ